MTATPPGPAGPKGFWGSLEGANKVVATLAAVATLATTVMGVVTAYTTIQLNKLKDEVDRLQKERTYATDIYTRYDAIMTSKATPEERVARLGGLLALTELIDAKHPTLRQRWAALIEAQSKFGAASAPDNPALSSQYRDLAARAAQVAKGYSWSNYDFDIFWCRGQGRDAAAKAIAEQVATLKAADPAAAGSWRVRSHGGATLKPGRFSITYDYEDERSHAENLKELLGLRSIPSAGTPFTIEKPRSASSRWYLSVWVCPA